jgi:uncharacterized protein (TIGR01777 family)
MKLGITGATGFIGARIAAMAARRGHEVIGFTRNPARGIPGCVEARKFSPGEKLDITGCEALIHLAGEPVFGLWTPEKRRRIRDSRVLGTRCVVDAILSSKNPPRVLVSSSAIGFHGDTGENETDEDSPAGRGFLADVCKEWEAEELRAGQNNARLVLLRTSVVLGPRGGAMSPMFPAFRAGLGGKLGSGRQWMAWIHLDDVAALALHTLEHEGISGPLEAVAPRPCRNQEFTAALARAVHRPAFFRVPALLLKSALGDFSHELLDSKRIVSKRIAATGFTHRFPSLDAALADIAVNWNCPERPSA